MYDIFKTPTKRKSKKISRAKIIADYREKNSLVPSELMKREIDVEFRELKVGDYLVNGVVVERKSRTDFFNSVFDKRIFSQLENMKECEKKFILVEGNINEKLPLHENALKGLLLSIGLSYKMPILFSKNEEDTAKYLSILINKKEKVSAINPVRKNLPEAKVPQKILESFPGIGPIIAKKLLQEFGSIKKIVNASEKEVSKILGKKYFEFQKILNLKPEVSLKN